MNITKGYWQYILFPYKLLYPHSSKSINQIGKLVKKENIDIFGGVEVDAGSSRTKNINQCALISKESSLINNKFFPTFIVKDRINQGNSIHSKHIITNPQNYNLKGKGEPRYLSKATITINKKEIIVLVVHLSLNYTVRESQLRRMTKIIDSFAGPVILMGDFNTYDNKELDLLKKSKLDKVITKPTFPSWNPKKHFDYIFLSKHFIVNEAFVSQEKLSDHLMLVVDCDFK